VKVSLYSFVALYSRGLVSLGHLLGKGSEHAQAAGTAEAEMLEWRLAPDMFSLRRQAEVVCNFARQWPARAAGLPVPESLASELSVSQLQASIAEAQDYLAGLRPEQFEGRDDVLLTFNLGQLEPTLPIGQWITGFATTNFYFHLSMVYAILRSRGVQLSKPDLFAGGL
jgi:hypothetical protein